MAADTADLARQIAALWAKTLRVDEVRVDDDYFELGGNSISAIRLVVVVGDQFSADLDVDFLFNYSTPAEFAAALIPLIENGSPTEVA